MKIPSGDETLGDIKTGPDVPEEPGIQMCEEHHKKIVELLEASETPFARTEEELKAKFMKRPPIPDALFEVCRVIMTLAIRNVGSVGLKEFKCPMCAMQKFDFLGHTVAIVAHKIAQVTSPILLPPDKKLHLI